MAVTHERAMSVYLVQINKTTCIGILNPSSFSWGLGGTLPFVGGSPGAREF
jgi:hypothetical protein